MRALALLAAFSVAGCNAVLGLDARTLDDDNEGADTSLAADAESDSQAPIVDDDGVDSVSADSSLPADTSTSPDTAPPSDTSPPPDTAPVDTGTPPSVCPIFGLTCAAGQACIVSRSSTGTYSYACETPPPGATAGANCHLVAGKYKCAAGLACNDRFPSGTICVPLCAAASACTSPANYNVCPAATWTTAPAPTVNVCDYCDPVAETGCTVDKCLITRSSAPPSCSKAWGGRDPGQSCNPGNCRSGTVCDCATELGNEGCGGATGVCVKLCRTNADCSLVAGTTCQPLRTGYPFNGCK